MWMLVGYVNVTRDEVLRFRVQEDSAARPSLHPPKGRWKRFHRPEYGKKYDKGCIRKLQEPRTVRFVLL